MQNIYLILLYFCLHRYDYAYAYAYATVYSISEPGIWKQYVSKEGLHPAHLENIIGSVRKAIKVILKP